MKQGIKQIVIIFAAALVLEVFLSNYTLLSCITKPHNQQADWSVYAADDGNEVCFIEEVGFEVQNIEIVYKDDADDFVKYVVTVNQEGSQYSDYSYPEKWDTMKKSTKFNLNCATPVNYIYIYIKLRT